MNRRNPRGREDHPGHATRLCGLFLIPLLLLAGADALASVLADWLTDPPARDYAGRCAFGYIERHLGAADRIAALLQELLDTPQADRGP